MTTPHTEPPRVICFDWGGVILRICRNWAEGCAAAELPVRPGADEPALVTRRRALAQAYQVGEIDCDAFCDQVAATTGGLYSPEEIGRIHDAWLIAEYDGAAELIERLAANSDVQLGLLSNTNRRHYERHRARPDGSRPDFPTIARLTHHVASHEVRASKPDEAIYRAFEDLTGARGQQIIFFDDLEENIAQARSIGWRAVQIDHAGDTPKQIERELTTLGVRF
ncbi:MAG: hypothetical protein EA378_04785 [Phycisphaerales bacterium]|nr:MAG: hypothetical protein EA378_04785 [Phycisphaerales bacterium]